MLAFAAQGWFLKKNTVLETALFLIGGLFLVFPAILAVLLKPLTGFDIGAFMPGLSDVGVRIGYNVLLGLVLFAAAVVLQRARRPGLTVISGLRGSRHERGRSWPSPTCKWDPD